ncbi:tetraspanin-16 isoform X2 [Anolis carolinensis]|uniref:tetraspanin-16 isoform X2 n=1 Tax=Anolis carolinensis TaxID=28377 RepID=UPI0004627717|nr:PREDICTED: tetraspanin-16 [Anolis carolinensis]|eukprot:XP_016846641.1 PREDICTED: tetraspanin-16 [Anolis carolinensis]
MSCFSFLKMMMFVFNGVIFIGGVGLLGIGIWVKMDSTSFVKVLRAASPHLMQLINVGYLCIAVGIFLLLMGFMGCWGSVKESKCLLLMFFVLTLILFIAEVAGAVVVLAFSSVADVFVEYLEKWAITFLKKDYGRQTDLTEIWNTTMEQMKCCGFNNYTDFSDSYFYQTYNKYPSPCCPDNKDCQESEIDESKQGCLNEFQVFLNKNGKIVGGVVLGIGALELAAMIASMFLYCQIGTSS